VFDFETKNGEQKGEVPAAVEKGEAVDFLEDVMKETDE